MAKKIIYTEGELIELFHLRRNVTEPTPRMINWLAVSLPNFDAFEQRLFDEALLRAIKNISAWSEEDLKMKFISDILPLGQLVDNGRFMTYFEKSLSGLVENIKLSVKTDFMVASGTLSYHRKPYFHFQEYKPQLNPKAEPMAQLLEAMLLAQTKNEDNKPIYGCEVVGETWRFVTLEGKDYCVSETFIATKKEDLLKIIAILRNFRHILETELLD
jgi:hypothetical protein